MLPRARKQQFNSQMRMPLDVSELGGPRSRVFWRNISQHVHFQICLPIVLQEFNCLHSVVYL